MEEAAIKKESTPIKLLKLFLKIAVTILCFWYISQKIDFGKAQDAFMKADWWWLTLSVFAFAFAKLLASFRLNIYFKNINIHLPNKKNIKLYWLGI
jgi:glycosyltransferase 2 family protein